MLHNRSIMLEWFFAHRTSHGHEAQRPLLTCRIRKSRSVKSLQPVRRPRQSRGDLGVKTASIALPPKPFRDSLVYCPEQRIKYFRNCVAA